MNRFAVAAMASISLLALAACSEATNSGTRRDREVAQENQTSLMTAHPVPILQRSEERENLIKRATRLNQNNMVGCVTVFTPNGVLLYQGVVDGKVSSLNSYLLPGDVPFGNTSAGYTTAESPDIDGAYGQNADGVFFFNADSDAYIEAGNVTYIYTDQCLKTEQKPLLVQQVAGQ